MKWFGKIAFTHQEETEDGIWEDTPIVREYYGDIQRLSKRDQLSGINSDLTITNTLSVVADPFLLNSFSDILYVEFMEKKWRVNSVEVGYPRLTMTLGSLYKEDSDEE